MAKIRHIKITNFRAIKSFDWWPNPGINCLIGPGDSGKSTVIDAIDLCLGPRRTKEFADSDFHKLNTDEPISIEVTVSDLADTLKNFDKYDLFLRGYRAEDNTIEDEYGAGLEPALTIVLTVRSDLDPQWSLFSDRAALAGSERALAWGDRVLLAGTRIDAGNSFHLSWRKGSVLDRLSDEKPDTAAKIAEAKRAACNAFSGIADDQLDETLSAVEKIAADLGVSLEVDLQALLNAHSISLSGGTIAVHDADGIPLSRLGLGSTRLLVSGLLNAAQNGSDLVLADELEHGLEPHRIIRLLNALGAKEEKGPKQAFFTSHSPIVLRELDAPDLFVLKREADEHLAQCALIDNQSQGAVRLYPEAFLSKRVLLCEGASEVGFIRGFEIHSQRVGGKSLFAAGLSLIDADGYQKLYNYSSTLQSLGFRCGSFRDADYAPDGSVEAEFLSQGGRLFCWQPGQMLEAAIIEALPASQIAGLVELGVELRGEDVVDQHLKDRSAGALRLSSFREAPEGAWITEQHRGYLASACNIKRNSWFKSVFAMQELTARLVAPSFDDCQPFLKDLVSGIYSWALDG